MNNRHEESRDSAKIRSEYTSDGNTQKYLTSSIRSQPPKQYRPGAGQDAGFTYSYLETPNTSQREKSDRPIYPVPVGYPPLVEHPNDDAFFGQSVPASTWLIGTPVSFGMARSEEYHPMNVTGTSQSIPAAVFNGHERH